MKAHVTWNICRWKIGFEKGSFKFWWSTFSKNFLLSFKKCPISTPVSYYIMPPLYGCELTIWSLLIHSLADLERTCNLKLTGCLHEDRNKTKSGDGTISEIRELHWFFCNLLFASIFIRNPLVKGRITA